MRIILKLEKETLCSYPLQPRIHLQGLRNSERSV